MNLFIVTGASKGLGFSIAKRLLEKENQLVCISRNTNKELINLAKSKGVNLKYYEFDLKKIDQVENLVKNIFSEVELKKFDKIYLVNNAGIINPVSSIEDLKLNEVIDNFYVNFLSAFVLTFFVLKYTRQFKGERIIVNISSKAASVPVKNWACYSISKTALDALTRYIFVEFQKKGKTKSISFHPPAMDTSMRKENIKAKNIFEKVWDFICVKILRVKRVYSPDEIAYKIISILADEKVNSGDIIEMQ